MAELELDHLVLRYCRHPMGEGPGVRASLPFWITGDPGVGKSAFAAQLTHARPDAVIAAQFVEWDKPDHRDARRVVRSLAFQLATRLPDYRKLLLTLPEISELDRKDPAELFDYLLANPLGSVIGGGRERQFIVIDALDEVGEAEPNPLVEMLARHAPRLPDWLGLVVTSRPESAELLLSGSHTGPRTERQIRRPTGILKPVGGEKN